MGSCLRTDGGDDVLRALDASIDVLQLMPLATLTDDELLNQARERERLRRRLAAADHALIAELEIRAVASSLGYASTAKLLTAVTRVAPGEAAGRVRAAAVLGQRAALTGELLAPVFPLVAAAQSDGMISARHAAIITETIRDLPLSVREVQGGDVEAVLTEHAHRLNPAALAQVAQRVTALLDADGTLTDEADRERRRGLTLTRHRDGCSTLVGRLTPELAEKFATATDAAAAPVPADTGGVRDSRSAAQRLHDAVGDVVDAALGSGHLRPSGGLPATVLVSMTLSQLERHIHAAQNGVGSDLVASGLLGTDRPRSGLAGSGSAGGDLAGSGPDASDLINRGLAGNDLVSTGHGGLLSVDAALRLADQARVALIVTDWNAGSGTDTGSGSDTDTGSGSGSDSGSGTKPGGSRVLGITTQLRAATTTQRLALAARDGGCSFPDCTVPPAWTQAHHVLEWARGGPTSLDNLTLVCGHHHRTFERNGWSCQMVDGSPHWIPPAFIDPARRPRTNTAHRVGLHRLRGDGAGVPA